MSVLSTPKPGDQFNGNVAETNWEDSPSKQLEPFKEGLKKHFSPLESLPILDLGDRDVRCTIFKSDEMKEEPITILKNRCNRVALGFLVQNKKNPQETGVLVVENRYGDGYWAINRTSLVDHRKRAGHSAFIGGVAETCDTCPFRGPNFTYEYKTPFLNPEPFLEALFNDEDPHYKLKRPSASWFSWLKVWG